MSLGFNHLYSVSQVQFTRCTLEKTKKNRSVVLVISPYLGSGEYTRKQTKNGAKFCYRRHCQNLQRSGNIEKSQEKQCYTEEMNKTLGEIGLIRKVNSNSLLVSFGEKSWPFHPAALSKVVFPSKDSKFEIAKVRSVLNKSNKDGMTALHIAVCEEFLDVVKRLLNLGCEVNTHDDYHDSVLLDGICRANVDIVSLLLENGADYTHQSLLGLNVLHVAAMSGCVDTFRMLLDKIDSKSLMKLNNQKAKNGRTPLHTAIIRDSTDVAKLLMQISGTDVNSQDVKLYTPLHLAVIKQNVELVKQLLQHGADKYIQDSSSNIPIDYAEKNYNRKISSLLQ